MCVRTNETEGCISRRSERLEICYVTPDYHSPANMKKEFLAKFSRVGFEGGGATCRHSSRYPFLPLWRSSRGIEEMLVRQGAGGRRIGGM